MGQIALSIPQVSAPNATEDPKVASDFTTLQTVINGQLDTNNLSPTAALVDTQLASPNNAVRRLLFQSAGYGSALTWSVGGESFYPAASGPLVRNGVGNVGGPLWAGDAGYSSNPKDFVVAGKTAKCIVRMTVTVNAVAPGWNISGGLAPVNSIPSTGNTLGYTLGAGVTGSQTPTLFGPVAGSIVTVESPSFTMPVTAVPYVLAVVISGGSGVQQGNSMSLVSLQLYGFNE